MILNNMSNNYQDFRIDVVLIQLGQVWTYFILKEQKN